MCRVGVVILVVVKRIARQFVDTVESQMPGARCWVCIGTSVNASSKPIGLMGGATHNILLCFWAGG
jgi:hypothetical protein